ncbi:Chorismate dehydratase [compost metagenome]
MAFAIGELSFISGLPVNLPIEKGWVQTPDIQTFQGLPGELDARMRSGELAAGPVSSLEFIRRRHRYELVPDLSISSWGRFASAVVFSKGSLGRLTGKTVALPRQGAASNVLAQWFLRKMFGSEPLFVEAEGTLEQLLEQHDAALIIGDQAVLESRKEHSYLTLDLGEGWWQLMKTPMVQTVWVVQKSLPEADQQALIAMFAGCRAESQARREEVLAEATRRLGIPSAEVEGYFQLLNYDLTPVHMQSINLFRDYLQEITTMRGTGPLLEPDMLP